MQQYVDQLLEDLKNAERAEQPVVDDDENLERHFEEVERWIEGNLPEHTLSYHCGLKSEVFPPAERLSSQQMALLIKGLNQLLFSWNITAEVPDKLAIEKTYGLMVSVLDREVGVVTAGFIGIEFCTYDIPSCPFGELCWCKKYEAEYDANKEGEDSADELPF
jgi:hypothetical protein